ncbi:hypothetical protein P7C71_g5214, partial [Lecanoromycetidae sp. Uapishka_2]
MLDSFEILTASGVVLWSKSYVPVSSSIINGFIKDVFIEEKVLPGASISDDASAAQNPTYKRDQYTLKWASVKDLECDFDGYFDQQVKELETSAEKNPQRAPRIAVDDLTPPSSSGNELDEPPPPLPGLAAASQPGQLRKPQSNGNSTDATPIPTPETSRPSTPATQVLAGKVGPKSRRARKAAATPMNASSGDERKARTKKDIGKKMRRWDADGLADEDDGTVLDYSAQDPGEERATNGESAANIEAIDSSSFGTRTGKGQFVLKDLDSEVHSILKGANEKKTESSSVKGGLVGSGLGAISGLFRNIIGGKVLTKEDLAKPMRGMEEHLLKKNVAREAAVRLCEGVERELIGVKTGSFESVETTVRSAMESSLRKILTPTTSLDILRSITSVT